MDRNTRDRDRRSLRRARRGRHDAAHRCDQARDHLCAALGDRQWGHRHGRDHRDLPRGPAVLPARRRADQRDSDGPAPSNPVAGRAARRRCSHRQRAPRSCSASSTRSTRSPTARSAWRGTTRRLVIERNTLSASSTCTEVASTSPPSGSIASFPTRARRSPIASMPSAGSGSPSAIRARRSERATLPTSSGLVEHCRVEHLRRIRRLRAGRDPARCGDVDMAAARSPPPRNGLGKPVHCSCGESRAQCSPACWSGIGLRRRPANIFPCSSNAGDGRPHGHSSGPRCDSWPSTCPRAVRPKQHC